MIKWTKEQTEAIEARQGNVLVSAAAGSGKTAVLVERIIQRVGEVDVDRLLVVTFTKAAAAEMKERVGLAIGEALRKYPLSRNLYRQSTLLNRASIMTLHSFCLEVVRENFYVLGLDPNFRIADDIEAQLLKYDALESLLEDYYQVSEEDSDFIKLVDAYTGQRDDSSLEDLIIRIHQFARSNPWPDHWLDQIANHFVEYNWFGELKPNILMELAAAKELLVQSFQLANKPQGPQAYSANLENEIVYLDGLMQAAESSWDELYQAFAVDSFSRLPSIKKGSVDTYYQNKVKDLRNRAKDIIQKMKDNYFLRSPEELVRDLDFLSPYLQILVQLIKDFERYFRELKTKKLLLDFSDLEHFCLQLLLTEGSSPNEMLPSQVCCKLKERFVEVLVDEYQDINDVQETILNLVARGNNLFMVGDVKQSIYRFRLAKPELFLEKYQSFDLHANSANRRIDLAKNFRCAQPIVLGVNYLFRQIMTPVVGEMAYDAQAELIYREEEIDPGAQPVEFYLLERKEDLVVDQLAGDEREAEIIGQRILGLIASGMTIYDQSLRASRPVTFSDFVILMRSPKNMVEAFLERFNYLGIPVFADLGSGYFSALEVQTIISLLKTIDNPRQDIPLVTVLRSPIVALEAEELAEIRLESPEDSFFEAVLKTSSLDSSLGSKIKAFVANLEKWRTIAKQGNLADLIWILYRETGYFDYVGSLPGGLERQANLRALHDRARQYEATSFRGLFRFLRFIERIEENKGDLDSAQALSENENVVRIISIHKSKGLEFPIVFVAGLGKQFNLSDGRQNIIIHKDLGLGPVLIDSEQRIKYPTIAKMAIEKKIHLETLAEEMRILYVALTRAQEKLVLVGSTSNLRQNIEKWCDILDYQGLQLPEYQLVRALSFLDWIGLALVRHQQAEVLRILNDHALEQLNLIEDDSFWEFNIYPKGYQEDALEASESSKLPENIRQLKPLQLENRYGELIAKRLDWQYPYHNLLDKGAKVSVSEVKHIFHSLQDEEEGGFTPGFSKRPAFTYEAKSLSAAEKGSALHLMMEQVDLREPVHHDALQGLASDLVIKEILTSEQAEAINLDLIVEFFQSSLGQRLQKAQLVKREMPFSLALPAGEIYDLPADIEEKVLVQGIIDCLWREDDGWVLLDYKSDQVPEGKLGRIIKQYLGQINLYTRALEDILQEPVKERYIYFFDVGQGVSIAKEDWRG